MKGVDELFEGGKSTVFGRRRLWTEGSFTASYRGESGDARRSPEPPALCFCAFGPCWRLLAGAVVWIWLMAFVGLGRAAEFDNANQLYDEGKFAEAKQAYERLVGSGEWSANLFYNLGNADYRSGAPGKAVLNYERALALEGSHAEARANLKWLREQTGAKTGERRWWEYAYPAMPGSVFAVVGVVAFWGGVFAVAGVIFRRRFFGWGAFAFVLAVYAAVGVWRADQETAVAIITGKETSAKLAPADRAGLAETLPLGSRVRVLSERGEWIYCALPGGGRGWIAETHLEKMRLRKS